MITGELRSKIDAGVECLLGQAANPLEVVEQITYEPIILHLADAYEIAA